jgi:hypothetical protein
MEVSMYFSMRERKGLRRPKKVSRIWFTKSSLSGMCVSGYALSYWFIREFFSVYTQNKD